MVVIRRKENVWCHKGVTFFSGVNALTDEQSKKMEKDPLFLEQVAVGNMSLVESPKSSAEDTGNLEATTAPASGNRATDSARQLVGFKTNDAIRLLSASEDLDVLNEVLRIDKRASVKAACVARINMLDGSIVNQPKDE